LHEQVRDARIKTLGPEHRDTLMTLHNLATMDLEAGKTTEAIAQLQHVHDVSVRVLGPEDPGSLTALHNLAVAYWKTKQLEKAIPHFEQLVQHRRKMRGETHPETLNTMANLGVNYRDAGRLEDAISLLERVHRDGRRHASLRWVASELLIAYARAGKSAQAFDLVKENLATARGTYAADSPQLATVLSQCGAALLELKAWAEAEPILRECLEIREKKEPDDWRTFNAQAMLGGALLGQKKYAEAEPLLIRGYEGMKKRDATISANSKFRVTEALERLVLLHGAWGKPDEETKWRKELEAQRTLGNSKSDK